MNDEDFVRAFENGTLPASHFHHRDHLRLTWLLARSVGESAASGRIALGIRRFAAHHGQADKYHETMTRFWVRLVAYAVRARPEIADFETFLATFPHVLDKDLPYRHWRRETIGSPLARREWVEPDLLTLPA